MNNYISSTFTRRFYSQPRGGYALPNPGAINRSAHAVVVKEKGRDAYRPAINILNQTGRA